MATYYISGVWFSGSHISHVFLHPVYGQTFYPATKTTEAGVVRLIEQQNTVYTIRWNYITTGWSVGALVEVENHPIRGKILRTRRDAVISDNLDNMINMAGSIA